MKHEFTKEKWEYVGGDNMSVEVNIGNATCNIDRCDKNTNEIVVSRNEMEANARLISAAPEMIEALISVESYLTDIYESNQLAPFPTRSELDKIRSAIKKAIK